MTQAYPTPIWRLSLKSLVKGHKRGGVHVIVAIATDETKARELAACSTTGTHGEEQYLEDYVNAEKTNCVQIGYALPSAPEGIVAVDFDYDYDEVKYKWVE